MRRPVAILVGLFMIILSAACIDVGSSGGTTAKLAQPVETPTATRPANTSTPVPTNTPVPTATLPPPTATPIPPTPTPVPPTPTPPPPTATRVPPTATPIPTATPVPTDTPIPEPTAVPPTPTPAFAFRSEGIKAKWPNCGLTNVFGTIRDAGGNPMAGVTVRVGTEGGWSEVSRPSDGGGKWDMLLQFDSPRAGSWYAYVVGMPAGTQQSPRTSFTTTDTDCTGSGVQSVQIDFTKN